MNTLEIVENGIVDLSERKIQINDENIKILESVKEILTLGDQEIITTRMAAEYFNINLSTLEMCISKNKKELIENGLKVVAGKEIRDKLVTQNNCVTNFRGYFEYENVRFANSKNTILTKRTILNIAMLLRDSKVAKDIRKRILDVMHDAENNNASISNIVHEIDEETKLSMDLGLAMVKGNMKEVMSLNTKIFELKNKRIKQLENVIENSTTINESKARIRMCVNYITPIKYRGIYGYAWNDLYKFINYKLGINVNNRKGKGLDRFTDEEIKQVEIVSKSWINQLGHNIDFKLK